MATIEEQGKVTGDEYQDRRAVRDTTLSQACQWFTDSLSPSRPDTKNKRSKIRYWQNSEFADWSLASLRPADLIRWRRDVLDEDGEEAECSAQTVIHRLNVLSQVYKTWGLAHTTRSSPAQSRTGFGPAPRVVGSNG